jgi:4,5-DOPA dioxygenase extradiol
MLLYPDADVPVVPISVQPHLDPAHHVAVGKALASLRDEDFLVIGSGSMTHNLHEFYALGRKGDDPALGWVAAFNDWVHDRLAEGDVDALMQYRTRAPYAAENHPTEEHILPLFIAIGAGGSRAQRVHASYRSGVISMDTYVFG